MALLLLMILGLYLGRCIKMMSIYIADSTRTVTPSARLPSAKYWRLLQAGVRAHKEIYCHFTSPYRGVL